MTNHGGTKYGDLIHPEDKDAVLREVQEAVRAGRSFQLEYRITTKHGRLMHVWEQGRLVAGSNPMEQWLEGFITDTTPRKQAEIDLHRVNRALRTIIECNRAQVRAAEESHLLEDICGILVREGGYRMAWVGFAENDEGQSVRPVAYAGFEEGYLQTADITWSDTERGRGPTGTAIRTGKPVVARDIKTDSHLATWREEQLKRGYASSIALPIKLNNNNVGALMVYAKEADAFDSEEMRLLSELSNDLAYGIQTLRTTGERKQAAEDLRLARFSVEYAPDSVIWSDIQSRILYANEAACRNLGRSLEELLSLTIPEIDPLFKKESWGTYWQTLRTLGTMTFVTQCISKLGGVLTLEVTANYQEFKGKGYCFSFGRDITERKRAEEALKENEEKYRSVVMNIPDVVWTIDSDGRVVFITPNIEKLGGFTAEEVYHDGIGLLIDTMHSNDRQRIQDAIEAVFRDRQPRNIEYRGHRKDGGWIWVEARAVGAFEKNGKWFVQGLLSDVTERKRAEEALRESEEKYRSLVSHIPDVAWTLDSELRFTFISKTIEKMCGFSLDEVDQNGSDLYLSCVHPDDVHNVKDGLRALFAEGRPYDVECRVWHKTGKWMWVHDRSHSTYEKDGTRYADGLLSDITERKRAEEEILFKTALLEGQSEATIDGILIVDEQNHIVLANKRFGLNFGIPDEVLSTLDDLIVRKYVADQVEDPSAFVERVDYLNSNRHEKSRDELKFKNGKVYDRYSAPLVDSTGRYRGRIWYFRDITDRKREQKAILESEERFRTLFESAPVGIYRSTPDGRFLAGNPALTGMLGYSSFEELAKCDLNGIYFDPEYPRSRFTALVEERGEVAAFEPVWRRPDGNVLHVRVNAQAVHDASGKLLYYEGTVEDITERMRLERLRREQLQFLQRLVDAVPTPIFQKDRQARYQMTNKAFEQFFGISKGDIIGKTALDITSPELAKAYYEKDMALLRDPGVEFYEGRLFRADGACRDFIFNKASLVEEHGAVEGIACGMVEITEQKQALEALRRSEERTAILNHVANAFLTIHSEEVYGEVLAIVLRVLGCPFGLYGYIGDNGDLIVPSMTRDIWDRCQVPDKPIVFPPETWGESLWGKAIRKGKTYRSAGPFRVPGGHVVINNCLTVPILFGGETIGLIIGANKERGFTEEDQSLVESICGYISPILQARLQRERQERKRQHAEEALRKSEERFKQVVENAGEWVWEVDVHGLYLYSSPIVEKILGYRPDELVGKVSFYDLFTPEVREKFRAHCSELFAQNHPREVIPTPTLRKDGSIAILENSAVAVLDESGNLRAYRGTSRDVTERKRVEEELRKLSRAVEQSPASVVITDLEGCIEYVNPKFTAVTGYTLEEVAGKNSRILNACLAPDETYIEMWNTLLSGGEWQGEFVNRMKNGKVFWESASLLPIKDLQGKITHILAVKEDITARKHLEDQFRQAQKMEAVGRLAGGIAHDFNNLLTVINGYAALLLRELKGGDPLRESVVEIQKAGEQAASLTRQLLIFSRKQIAEPRPLDLNQFIDDNLGMLQRLVGEDIGVETHLAPSLWTVVADPGQIHQVLLNLVVNARDAMPRGGMVTLATSNVDVKEGDFSSHPGIARGHFVLFSVADTGTGIEAEALEHIFDPFFTTKGKGEGTGLGLATVYGIVQQAGGSISVHSKLGHGAAFQIYLPRSEAAISVRHKTAQAPALLRGTETVLVVEDQDPVRKLTVRILKRHGYHVLEAAQGDEALLLVESYSQPIHLLLTDVVMPGMNGPELAKRLKPARPAMRVLYMSGYAADVITNRGLLEPGQKHIAKPFAPEELAQRVREVLGPVPAPVPDGVLVVDDESQVRGLFQKVLAGAGYKVQLAKDGNQALKMARAQQFDLVVVDLVMPEREGIEIIQTLRKEQPTLKIIAVSGAFGGGFLKVAKLLGANTTLAKPVDLDQLLSAVRDVLG
jgi:PAS domain S-box-containing protein